jgi:DNA replication and repair protein RecF
MFLKSIALQHFRNISQLELEFSEGINIFRGDNGQGKTNIIESIFALALSRPFRSREKNVFIEHGAQFSKIEGTVNVDSGQEELLEIFWDQSGRGGQTVFRKNKVQKTSTAFLEQKHLFAVLFAPEDMELPFATPKKRRQILSRVLSPLFPEYLTALVKYEKVLKRRNKLLSDFPKGHIKKMEFDFWDTELVKWSQVITKYRREFFQFLTLKIGEKYELISRKNDTLLTHYMPSVQEHDDFLKVLEKNFHLDVRYGATQRGPHRDDFFLELNSRPLEEAASRGEIRSAIIAFKLCERDFIAEHTSLFPVMLLDDVFSELDEFRRKALLDIVRSNQVFISTTDTSKFHTKKAHTFVVKEGRVNIIER